jgi:PAS domain S-box-containing protein
VETALAESEIKYRHLFESSNDAIMLLDAERFFDCNRATLRIFGYSTREEFLGKHPAGVSPPRQPDGRDSRAAADEKMATAFRAGRSYFEWLHQRADGTVFAADVLLTPMDFRGQRVLQATVRDISDRKQAELQAEAERDRLRRILDAMQDGVYMVGRDWRLQYINPALLVRGGPVNGRKCYEYFHGRSEPCPDCANPKAFAGASTHRKYTTRQGDITYDIQDVPVTGDDGQPARLVFLRDITAHKRADEALRQNESRYKHLFEESPSGIALVDSDGVVQEANSRALELLGIGREDLVGRSFRQLLPEFDLDSDEHDADFRSRLAGRPAAREITFRIKSGERKTIEVQSSIVGGAGKTSDVMFLITDVTARKRAEAELARHRGHLEELVRERTAELEAANRELEAFSYSVSHDLRAPLRAIDGFAQALVEDCETQLDAKARGHLDRVSSAAQRMAVLIDDLLNLAHIARLPLERKEVDLSDLARSITAELRRAAPDRNVEFVIPDGLTAPADPVLTEMVLQNLLDNAWKFTSGHPTARIEFGTTHDGLPARDRTQTGGERVFFVRDDGVGFDMTYADKLFAPFQRLHSEREFSGSGIGLAIVQRIVWRHGGRVWFEAEVNGGAVCWFTLEPVPKEVERGREP